MLWRSRLAPLSALLVLAATSACDELVPDADLPLPDTEIAIDPADFLGDVPCSNNPGAMRSYVVTLVGHKSPEDHLAATPPDTSTEATSIAIPCSVTARFRNLQPDDGAYLFYFATIKGYETGADELNQLIAANNTPDADWGTQCGLVEGGSGAGGGTPSTEPLPFIQAADSSREFLRPCDPLTDDTPGDSQLLFSPQSVFGSDVCALTQSYDLLSEDGQVPSLTDIACDSDPIPFPAEPGQSYQLYARTTTADGDLGSLCNAVAQAQVTTPFQCNPISDSGSIALSLVGLVDAARQPLCPASGSFDVSLDSGQLNTIPLSCTATPLLGPFVASSEAYAITTTIYDGQGTATGAASCSAVVLAGKQTSASCTPAP